METMFLENRHFTFGNIKAEITKYELLMKELWSLVTKILN